MCLTTKAAATPPLNGEVGGRPRRELLLCFYVYEQLHFTHQQVLHCNMLLIPEAERRIEAKAAF
jgi:hypothetical protein